MWAARQLLFGDLFASLKITCQLLSREARRKGGQGLFVPFDVGRFDRRDFAHLYTT